MFTHEVKNLLKCIHVKSTQLNHICIQAYVDRKHTMFPHQKGQLSNNNK